MYKSFISCKFLPIGLTPKHKKTKIPWLTFCLITPLGINRCMEKWILNFFESSLKAAQKYYGTNEQCTKKNKAFMTTYFKC